MASTSDAIVATLHANDKKTHSDVPVPLHSVSTNSQQVSSNHLHIERTLGETEASYFLPSRESGVNDM